MANNYKCASSPTSFLGYCERKPSVVRDGVHYCWQHDPERLEKQRKLQWEQRKAELARLEAKIDKDQERRILLKKAGLDVVTNEQLHKIIELGGITKIIETGENK